MYQMHSHLVEDWDKRKKVRTHLDKECTQNIHCRVLNPDGSCWRGEDLCKGMNDTRGVTCKLDVATELPDCLQGLCAEKDGDI